MAEASAAANTEANTTADAIANMEAEMAAADAEDVAAQPAAKAGPSMEADGWTRLSELEPKARETFQDWEMTFTQPGKQEIDGGRVFFRAHKIRFDKAPGSLVSSGRLIFKAHRLTATTDPNTWVRPVLAPYLNPVVGWQRRVELQSGVSLQVGKKEG